MQGLDLFTLNCVTIANMYLSSGAMYFVSRLNGRKDGIAYCAIAGFVTSVGFSLAPFRDALPGQILNLAANVLIFWGACLLLRGIRGFRELRRVKRWRFIGVTTIYSAAYAYFLYVHSSLRVRSILASAALSALLAASAWSMAVNVRRRDRSVYWTTAGLYALAAVAAAVRAVWFVRAVPHPSLFSNYPVEFLSIAAVNLSAMGGAFGLCLATNLTLMREAETLALYDPLTSLPNRRLLEERLAQAEVRAHASGLPLALIYCDLDDFKNVNDRLGHEAGDQVLKVVADRLRRLVHEDACLARVGGDEFIALIENAGSRDALHELVGRMSRGVEAPIHMDGETVLPAISCGLAVYPEDVGSASDLVRLADAAMYAMKQHGRMAAFLPEQPV